MSSDAVLITALLAGVAALVLAAYYARVVLAADQGNDRMKELSAAIREGANAFMRREYTWVAVFVVVLAVLISVVLPWGAPWGSIAYIFGAVLSAGAGFVGMRIATAANARTTEAARQGGVKQALPLAFPGWCGDGLQRGRSGPSGCSDRLRGVRETAGHRRRRPVQHHRRHRVGGLLDRPVRPGRRWHLHEGGRHRGRPGRQGRGRDPRGRSS